MLFQTGAVTVSGRPRYGGADTGRSVLEVVAASSDEGGLHIIGCAGYAVPAKSVVFEGVNFGSGRGASALRSESAVELVHPRPFFT